MTRILDNVITNLPTKKKYCKKMSLRDYMMTTQLNYVITRIGMCL